MPKLNREGRALVLDPAEIKQVFTELDLPHQLIAQLCYYIASRVGEIVSLKREAIIGQSLVIRQPKTGRVKEVRIHEPLQAALDQVRLPSRGYLFPGSGKTGHLTVRGFEKKLSAAYALLGICGPSTHSFRCSIVTHLCRAGVDLESIRLLNGHASLQPLTLYIDVGRHEVCTRKLLM